MLMFMLKLNSVCPLNESCPYSFVSGVAQALLLLCALDVTTYDRSIPCIQCNFCLGGFILTVFRLRVAGFLQQKGR